MAMNTFSEGKSCLYDSTFLFFFPPILKGMNKRLEAKFSVWRKHSIMLTQQQKEQ